MYNSGMTGKFRILSIDGGGLKGLIAIKILQAIERLTGKAVKDQFDLFAGTSTGGLIVSALACARSEEEEEYNLDHIETMYLEVGQELFRQGGLSYSEEDVKTFDGLLERTFDGYMLSQTLSPVFVPTYDVANKKVVIFKTRSAKNEPSKNVTLHQVCRATTAIPPVFPVYIMQYHNRELRAADAGPYLKNPAVSALAEVWKHKAYYASPDLKEEDVVLLSVSTGNYRTQGAEWTTDIRSVLSAQEMDMEYIRSQNLKIDFAKVNYLRVDMNLGGSPFSLAQILHWIKKIQDLSGNRAFEQAVIRLLG